MICLKRGTLFDEFPRFGRFLEKINFLSLSRHSAQAAGIDTPII
jgi:hypothetical protein